MHGLPTLSILAVSLSACAGPAPRLVSFSSDSTTPGCVRVSTGRDVNHDGRLDEGEVLETEIACDDPSAGHTALALDVGPDTVVAPAGDRSLVCIEGGRTPVAGTAAFTTRATRRPRPAPRRRPGARRRVQRRWLTTLLRRFVALVSPLRAS